MRLLNGPSLQMKEFFEEELPKYAILSHTWGDEEVSYQDFQNESLRERKCGFRKVREFCAAAARHGYEWVWIDTCCIDKTSSAELSEAINSMFRWYQMADRCFAYLADVENSSVLRHESPDFRMSRWFRRGWTLQELLAPETVWFCDKSWNYIGDRRFLSKIISSVTGIPNFLLIRSDRIRNTPIAQRFSWAANRKTSKKEDRAYCLLGLLDVNMPLLYGEGDKAFIRLQEELIKRTYDHTILAWGFGIPFSLQRSFLLGNHGPRQDWLSPPCLASSPDAFGAWNSDFSITTTGNHYLSTNLGIYIELPTIVLNENNQSYGLALLDCGLLHGAFPEKMALPLELRRRENGTVLASRAQGITPFLIPMRGDLPITRMPLYLSSTTSEWSVYRFKVKIYLYSLVKIGYSIADFFPPCGISIPRPNFFASTPLCIFDRLNCRRLFRLCHSDHKTILLSVQPISPNPLEPSFPVAELKIATTTSSLTSWQHLMEPTFYTIDFERLYNSLVWVSKGHFTQTLSDIQADWEGRVELDPIEIENLRIEKSQDGLGAKQRFL
ncbi:HET-domain-containing protein [Hypoxylon sp. FL0890]|nr:HET-domain-containing protein [Hypoxylon sp. FL0890]